MELRKSRIVVFASGSKEGGGSGFENMVNTTQNGILNAEVSAVVSNHEHGGVRERADRPGISFIHFPLPRTAERYQAGEMGSVTIYMLFLFSRGGGFFLKWNGWKTGLGRAFVL